MEEKINALDPHYSFAALFNSFALPISSALGLTALGLAGMAVLPQISIAFLFVAGTGLFVFVVAFHTFFKARNALITLFLEWQNDKANARAVALARVENEREQIKLQITLKGNASAHFGTENLQQNLIIESRDVEQDRFLAHYTEFLRVAAALRKAHPGDTGFERKHYRIDAGAASNYQFRDAEMGRGEYDRLVKLAMQQGIAPDDRRRGYSGTPNDAVIDAAKYTPIE